MTLPLLLDRRRAADDRVVRVQLQQLQQHLPAHRRRAGLERPSIAGVDRHPHLVHVQARVRGREGQRLRRSRRRSRSSSSSSSPRSPASASGARRHWRTSSDDGRAEPVAAGTRGRRAAKPPRPRRASATTGGATWSGSSRCVFALFPVWFVVSSAFNANQSTRRLEPDPDARDAAELPRPAFNTNLKTSTSSTAHYVALVRQLADRPRRRGDLQRPARRVRRVRVQPLPLQGPALRDARAAPDPDVPADLARRRDLPDPAPASATSSRPSG